MTRVWWGLVVLGVVATAACSSGAGTTSEPSPTLSTAAGTTEQSAGPTSSDESATARLDDGDIEGAVIAELDVEVTPPAGFVPARDPVDVSVPPGVVLNPVLLGVPGSPPPSDAVPLMLHRNDSGGLEAIPALYYDGQYVALVRSFSWYWPGWAESAADWVDSTVDVVIDAAGDIVEGGANWLTGRTSPPEPCGSDPYEWVATSGSPADGAFHVCVEQNPADDGTERIEVKIKSNRAFAMWVSVPRTDADYVWVEGSSWDVVGPVLTAVAGVPADRVLLGPGRTLTVGYRRPADVGAELSFVANQDTVTQFVTMLNRHVGDINGELGTVLAMISCLDRDATAPALLSWDRVVECGSAAAGATTNQIEQALDRAIDSGRAGLSRGDRDRFVDAVLRTDQLNGALSALDTISGVLTWGRLAADAVVLANDAATALAQGAGTLNVTLIPTPRPTTTPPTEAPPPADPVVASCEGLDTSPVMLTAVAIVDSACSWPWALVAFTEPQPRLSVAVLRQDGAPSEQLAYFTDVQDGEVAGYNPQAIAEFSGMPLPIAELLFTELGGTNPGDAPTVPARTDTPVAGCVASGRMFIGMDGPDPEVALLQTRLRELGYAAGEIDGYFGPNTWNAVVESQTQFADGTSGGNGVFADEQTILEPVFERLGIAC